jgi:hypothetical protein
MSFHPDDYLPICRRWIKHCGSKLGLVDRKLKLSLVAIRIMGEAL